MAFCSASVLLISAIGESISTLPIVKKGEKATDKLQYLFLLIFLTYLLSVGYEKLKKIVIKNVKNTMFNALFIVLFRRNQP
jgi:hypothetical protein